MFESTHQRDVNVDCRGTCNFLNANRQQAQELWIRMMDRCQPFFLPAAHELASKLLPPAEMSSKNAAFGGIMTPQLLTELIKAADTKKLRKYLSEVRPRH